MSFTNGGTEVNDLSADAKLDSVLNILYEHFEAITIDGIAKKLDAVNIPSFSRRYAHGKGDTGPYIQKIVDKLIEDGFADKKGPDGYEISFNGIVFQEKDGYTARQKKESSKRYGKFLRRVLITSGTVGAGLYGIEEISLHFHLIHAFEINAIQIGTGIYLLLSGILIGIAIPLIMQEVSRRRI
jgi:hypothetical protein